MKWKKFEDEIPPLNKMVAVYCKEGFFKKYKSSYLHSTGIVSRPHDVDKKFSKDYYSFHAIKSNGVGSGHDIPPNSYWLELPEIEK